MGGGGSSSDASAAGDSDACLQSEPFLCIRDPAQPMWRAAAHRDWIHALAFASDSPRRPRVGVGRPNAVAVWAVPAKARAPYCLYKCF